MSQAPTATAGASRRDRAGEQRVFSAGDGLEAALDALEDDDCRAILDATSGEALTAEELTERCGLSNSTTYRKLDELTEVGFLEEHTRISSSGHHTSEYTRSVADVTVSFDDDGSMELRVLRCDDGAD